MISIQVIPGSISGNVVKSCPRDKYYGESYPYTGYLKSYPSSTYTFKGWSYDGSKIIDTDLSHGFTQAQYDNGTTIYLVFEKITVTYSLEYNLNGDTSGAKNPETTHWSSGELVSLVSIPSGAKKSLTSDYNRLYYFNKNSSSAVIIKQSTYAQSHTTTTYYPSGKWNLSGVGNVDPGYEFRIRSNKTATLVWDPTAYSSTIYDEFTFPTTDECYRSNYTLLGFSKDSSAETASYTPGSSKKCTDASGTTYYAIWKENPKYTLYINSIPEGAGNPSGGGGPLYNNTFTVNANPTDDYAFTKWSQDSWSPTTISSPTSEVTTVIFTESEAGKSYNGAVYANYTKKPKVTVKVGTNVKSITVTYTPYGVSSAITKTISSDGTFYCKEGTAISYSKSDVICEGGYHATSGGGAIATSSKDQIIASPDVDVDTYTLIFNDGGGSGGPGSMTIKYGSYLSNISELPSWYNHKFDGYYYSGSQLWDSTGTAKASKWTRTGKEGDSFELAAKWIQYTVRYSEGDHGDSSKLPKSVSGYLTGFYVASYMPVSTVVDTYISIIYRDTSGPNSATVSSDTIAKYGNYSQISWYSDINKRTYSASSSYGLITKDDTLVAQWADREKTYSSIIAKSFTCDHYVLSGWYTDSDFRGQRILPGTTIDYANQLNGKNTLYAKWIRTDNEYNLTVMTNNSAWGSASCVTTDVWTNIKIIKAVPAEGYYLDKWEVVNGGVSFKAGNYVAETNTVTMSGISAINNATVRAVFKENPKLYLSSCTNMLGDESSLIPTYGVGYVKVTYNGKDYTQSARDSSSNNFWSTNVPVKPGSVVTIIATPTTGYKFKQWSSNYAVSRISATTRITMPRNDLHMYAMFEEHYVNITVKKYNEIATVAFSFGVKNALSLSVFGGYDANQTTQTLKIKQGYNYKINSGTIPEADRKMITFDGWYDESGVKEYSSSIVELPAVTDKIHIARYNVEDVKITYKISASEGGVIIDSLSDGSTHLALNTPISYRYGSTLNLQAVANYGYKCTKWIVVNNDSSSPVVHTIVNKDGYLQLPLKNITVATFTDYMVGKNMTVTAVFEKLDKNNYGIKSSPLLSGTSSIIVNKGVASSKVSAYMTDSIVCRFEEDTKWNIDYFSLKMNGGILSASITKKILKSSMKKVSDYIYEYELTDEEKQYNCSGTCYFKEIKEVTYKIQKGYLGNTLQSNVWPLAEKAACITTPASGTYKAPANTVISLEASVNTQLSPNGRFKYWKISGDSKSSTITDSSTSINLSDFGDCTITAIFNKGTLEFKTCVGGVNGTLGDYPQSSGISADDWIIGREKYYKAKEDCNTGIFGQCTWYVNGRSAELHDGYGAPCGNMSWPDVKDWPLSCAEGWRIVTDASEVQLGDVGYNLSPHVVIVEGIDTVNHPGQVLISDWNNYNDDRSYTLSSNETRWTNVNNYNYLTNDVHHIDKVLMSTEYDSQAETVAGSAYIYIGDQKTQSSTFSAGDSVTMKAIANEGYKAMYWVKPDGEKFMNATDSNDLELTIEASESTKGTYCAIFMRTSERLPTDKDDYDTNEYPNPDTLGFVATTNYSLYTDEIGFARYNYKLNKWLIGGDFYKYETLPYINSDASKMPWIDTNWHCNYYSEVVIDGQFISFEGIDEQLMGSSNLDTSNNESFLIKVDSHGLLTFTAGDESKIVGIDTNRHTFKLSGDGNCVIDSTDISCSPLLKTQKSTFKLFSCLKDNLSDENITPTVSPSNFKLYSCKMYDLSSGTRILIRDFVPARRKVDNKIGLWDKVYNKFYTNKCTALNANIDSSKVDFTCDDEATGILEKTYYEE